MVDISVIILTHNEKIHIRRCIENVAPWVKAVFVVDSFSTDLTEKEVLKFENAKTLKLDELAQLRTSTNTNQVTSDVFATACGAPSIYFVQNKWEGFYARQFNWALDHLPIRTKWVLRLDADEYLCPELIEEIKRRLDALPGDVTGVVFNLRRIFMGHLIKYGLPKVKLLRMFQYGKTRCEQRLMDEHMELLEGRSVEFNGNFVDHNLNDIGWWTVKHNGYALREAVDLLDLEYGLLKEENGKCLNAAMPECRNERDVGASGVAGFGKQVRGALEGQAAAKRAKKLKYARLPLFWRAFAYFCYRYFLRGGFLDGKEGFLWHFLQGWWYRTLVDAKIWEIERESGGNRDRMLVLLREKYGMKI